MILCSDQIGKKIVKIVLLGFFFRRHGYNNEKLLQVMEKIVNNVNGRQKIESLDFVLFDVVKQQLATNDP